MIDGLNEAIHGPDPLEEEFGKRGISVETYVDKLIEELEAMETKFFQHQGEVISREDVIAWGIRQKARQDLGRDLGIQKPERMDMTVNGSLMGLAVQVAQNMGSSDKYPLCKPDEKPQKPEKKGDRPPRKPRKQAKRARKSEVK